MLTRIAWLVTAFGLIAALAGCSSAPPVSSPTRASVPLPEEVHIGQKFAIRDQQGRTLVNAAIDEVRMDPDCRVRADKSQRHQHQLAILMTFDTTSHYRHAGVNLAGPPERADFRIVGPYGVVDKTVRPPSGQRCAVEEGVFRTRLRPSTHYQGWVLLQTEHDRGTLYYRPQGAMSLPGWEIHFPVGEER